MSNYWDTTYKTGRFNLLWDHETPTPELVATIATQGKVSGKKALDIGCGGGTEAIFLAQCGYQVIGVDMSEEALKIAENRAEALEVEVGWKKGNALELPVESDTIDFINDRGCFHIIPACDRPKYAKEVSRVLRSEGAVLLRGVSKRIDKACNETKQLVDILQEVGLDIPPFEPVTQEVVNEFFPVNQYCSRFVYPLTSTGRQALPMNLVYLKKT